MLALDKKLTGAQLHRVGDTENQLAVCPWREAPYLLKRSCQNCRGGWLTSVIHLLNHSAGFGEPARYRARPPTILFPDAK